MLTASEHDLILNELEMIGSFLSPFSRNSTEILRNQKKILSAISSRGNILLGKGRQEGVSTLMTWLASVLAERLNVGIATSHDMSKQMNLWTLKHRPGKCVPTYVSKSADFRGRSFDLVIVDEIALLSDINDIIQGIRINQAAADSQIIVVKTAREPSRLPESISRNYEGDFWRLWKKLGSDFFPGIYLSHVP